MPDTNPAPDVARMAFTMMVNRAIASCGTASELARRMGTGMSQIQRLRDTNKDVQLTTMQRVADASGLSFHEWLRAYCDTYGNLATASIEPPAIVAEPPRRRAVAKVKGVTTKRRRRKVRA
jgi:hypothetical protein